MTFSARGPFRRSDDSVMIGVICCCRRPKQRGKVARGGKKKEKKRRNLIESRAAERLARPRRSERGSLQIKI